MYRQSVNLRKYLHIEIFLKMAAKIPTRTKFKNAYEMRICSLNMQTAHPKINSNIGPKGNKNFVNYKISRILTAKFWII